MAAINNKSTRVLIKNAPKDASMQVMVEALKGTGEM